jgi:uncharacterized Zn-binding protein involved in type VI secretion
MVIEADQRFDVYAACIDACRYSWPLAMGCGDGMGIEIIRQGDKTTHGGIVLEGSPTHLYMGKPVALVGHNVSCPKCKGMFPIAEGAPTAFFGGKNVALAGMRTACGAVLIATQFTGTIESGGATTGSAPVDRPATPTGTGTKAAESTNAGKFDDKFVLLDEETGQALAFTEYGIRRASGAIEFGTTDAEGHTHLLSATAQAEAVQLFV